MISIFILKTFLVKYRQKTNREKQSEQWNPCERFHNVISKDNVKKKKYEIRRRHLPKLLTSSILAGPWNYNAHEHVI